jgi:hypothetical protein
LVARRFALVDRLGDRAMFEDFRKFAPRGDIIMPLISTFGE